MHRIFITQNVPVIENYRTHSFTEFNTEYYKNMDLGVADDGGNGDGPENDVPARVVPSPEYTPALMINPERDPVTREPTSIHVPVPEPKVDNVLKIQSMSPNQVLPPVGRQKQREPVVGMLFGRDTYDEKRLKKEKNVGVIS